MSFLGKISNFIFGKEDGESIASVVTDTIKEYYPPDLTEAQKQQLELGAKHAAVAVAQAAQEMITESEKAITERIVVLEGSAKDLRTIPVLGSIVIFLRAAYRPVFAYAISFTAIAWWWGTTSIQIPPDSVKEQLLYWCLIIVLIFHFGERAVRAALPMMTQWLSAFKSNKEHRS